MALKSRLDTLRRQVGATPTERGAPLGVRLERLGGRAPTARGARSVESPAALAERVGGQLIAEQLILVEQNLTVDVRHGSWPLGVSLETAAPGLLPEEAVFLDTETTGLSGGTGTVAFMIGVGQINGKVVRLRQWLMTAYSAERAMLEELARTLADARAIVSYNGKSFDMPLLRDRRRMQRDPPLAEPAHHDLLHPIRRLYGRAWADCRLATVERELLGLSRRDDLPGAEAPLAWKDYLSGLRGHALPRVLTHNALDVLSLLVLPGVLGKAMHDPRAHRADPAAVSQAWARAGDPVRALEVLAGCESELDARGRLMLAQRLRRAGRKLEAVGLWESLAGEGCQEAIEHLAKYHEHDRRDWAKALAYAHHLPDGAKSQRRRHRLGERLRQHQGRLPL